MLQFYFLSVLLNLIIGLILFCSLDTNKNIVPINGDSENTYQQNKNIVNF